MNVERLNEIVIYLVAKDSELGLQSQLVELKSHLAGLASQPQSESHQSNTVSSLNALLSQFEKFDAETTPPQKVLIGEIKGTPFFSIQMVNLIKEKFTENAVTPAIVSTYVSDLTTRRTSYLQTLTGIQQGLQVFGVEQSNPSPGEVELGVLFPRDLFHNELGDLAQEFEVLNRILQIFSEVTTGAVEPIQVRQISTSDPTIFLSVPVVTVLALGKATDWLIEKWKAIEEIRKVRAEIAKLKIDAAIKPMDDKIDETVKASIQEQVTNLIGQYKGERGRKHELEAGLHWALDSLISRIERGMTIEIRVLAPPQRDEGDEETDRAQMYTEVDTVGRRLQSVNLFQEQPILKLPPPKPPEHTQDGDGKQRKTKS
jgi:hypothetical protein